MDHESAPGSTTDVTRGVDRAPAVVLSLGSGPGSGRAAAATLPTLTSLTRVTAVDVQPGDTVTYAYAASAPLTLLRIVYQDTMSRTMFRDASNLPSSGQFSVVVPSGLLNGTETCVGVLVYDAAGNGAEEPCPTPGAADLAVSGSTPDTAAPVLTAVGPMTPTVTPGQALGIDYSLSGDSSLSYVSVVLVDRFGARQLVSRGELPATGTISPVVPPGWADGPFSLKSISVQDVDGNGPPIRLTAR